MSATRGTTSEPELDSNSQGLRGNLGVWSIVFMVVAAAAPLTVVGGVMPIAFGIGNGAGVPMAFVLAAAVLVLFSVGFTAMTPYVKSRGAFYAYVQAGLGRSFGIGTGYAALVTYTVIYTGVYALMGTGLQEMIVSLNGPDISWWVWALIAFVITNLLGYRNINISGRILSVLLVAEVAIVLVVDAAIVFTGGGDDGFSTGFLAPTTVLAGAPGLAILFAMLSFIGFEATAIFRDEARDPEKTIPRATYLAVVFVGFFYAITAWLIVSAFGDDNVAEGASSGTLLTDLSSQYLGKVGADIAGVLYVTSVFACLLTFHNVVARYHFSLASRGLLPKQLASVHPRYKSPYRASIAAGIVSLVALIIIIVVGLEPLDQFYTWFSGFGSVGYALLLTITSAAVLVFLRKNAVEKVSLWRRFIAPALALIALLGFLILIGSNIVMLTGEAVVAVIVVVALVAVYLSGPIIARAMPGVSLNTDDDVEPVAVVADNN